MCSISRIPNTVKSMMILNEENLNLFCLDLTNLANDSRCLLLTVKGSADYWTSVTRGIQLQSHFITYHNHKI